MFRLQALAPVLQLARALLYSSGSQGTRRHSPSCAPLWVAAISLILSSIPIKGVAQSPAFVWQLRAGGTIGDARSVCASANTSYPHGSNTFTPTAGMNLYPVTASDQGSCDNNWTSCSGSRCASGVFLRAHGVDVIATPPSYYVSAEKRPNTSCKANCLSDPIDVADGAVVKREDDYTSTSQFGGLGFARFYGSLDASGSDVSPGWRHSYTRQVSANYDLATTQPYDPSSTINSSLYPDPASACTNGFAEIQAKVSTWGSATTATYSGATCVLTRAGVNIGALPVLHDGVPPLPAPSPSPVGYDVTRDDGQQIHFTVQNGVITNPPGATLRLQVLAAGYAVIDANDNVENYNSAGNLLSITTRTGVTQTLTYNQNSSLSAITDNFGHALTLAYDSTGRLSTLTDPNQGIVTYSYDSQGRLSVVTYPDRATRTYLYEYPGFTNGLTGELDENGSRLSTWDYDNFNRGVDTNEAGGANATTLVYNTDGSMTATDALGAVRTFTFGRFGDLDLITGISGSQCPSCTEPKATTYDPQGFLSSRTDYNGNVTQYTYDDNRGLETSRTEAYGSPRARTITTQWDPTYRLPALIAIYASGSATGTPLSTRAFTYDASGNQRTKTVTDTSVTPNVSRTWTYTYDNYGRLLTTDGPRTDISDITAYTYYTCTTGYECGQVHTVTDAAGNQTIYNSYNAFGQPLTITDPNGVLTTLTYDGRQRLTSRQVGSETTALAYWPTGLLKQVTLPDHSYLLYSYDAAHRLTQISDSLGNRIVYTLDGLGNRTAEKRYDPSNALHRTHGRVFNTLSELYQDLNAAGTSAVTTTFGYDTNGNQTSIAAPLSRNTENAYDELNRLKQITDPANGTTQFGHDAKDNLVSVTDPRSLITSYSYNGFGDLVSQLNPDTGTTINTYDSAGNLATCTDARGAVATYAYDALNRVTSVAYSLAGATDQTIAFTYDAGTNGKGHLTGASDANHSLSWGYDALGRVISKAQTVAGVTKPVGYVYTSGDLTALRTPSGQTVTYGYNSNHQVTSISVNGMTVLNGVTYEPLGPINGWTWGNSTAVTRSYDGDGNITQISSNGLQTLSYDNASRISGIVNTVTGSANWTYGYDTLDRLTSGGNGVITRGWSYDANGNRLTETGTSPSTYSVSANSNQITGITGALARTYAYDAAGHATGYAGMTATYNTAGRLQTVTHGSVTETLVYNALGQRIQTSGGPTGTVLYWYDEQGHLLGEYEGSGTLIEETVWLGDIPVATLRPSGSGVAIYYVHTDQLNTPRQVTRPADNAQMWTWFSDPFGTDAANSNPSGSGTFAYNLRFPGQVFDGQVGLHSNYFRDFDPATGRYIESDPIGLVGGTNTFAYADGNPVSYMDPSGLECAASGASVTCNVPGGLTISFPRPPGWPASINSSDKNYHYYNKSMADLGQANKKCLDEYIRNHPTPGSPNPATPNGTPNDASPWWAGPVASPVLSYSMSVNGGQVVVNVTQPGHPLFPGYVARTVATGATTAGPTNVINNYGEGIGWPQSSSDPLAFIINGVWYGLTEDAIKACTCHQ
jgi:RHS repeat-associated protein